jgi:two-component system OmpR family sensor kinase
MMSLRRRLLVGCVSVALVLLAADLALATTFRAFLVGRVDRQLGDACERLPSSTGSGPSTGGPRAGGPGGRDGPGGDDRRTFTEFFLADADTSGKVVSRYDDRGAHDVPAPQASPTQVISNAVTAGDEIKPFTARAADGAEWRLASLRSDDGFVLVGVELGNALATLDRMQLVLGAATAAVLLTLLLVAAWVLRQGVHPLSAMTVTAGTIAAGDLSQRVEHTDGRTEAGKLGSALNTMMSTIEGAFAQRSESEERLRRFVADASHELRTPLTSIRGYAELYRTGALRDQAQIADAMRRVEGEATRMSALVNDLLLLARLDQGRPLEMDEVHLADIAADAVADARASDPARTVHLDAVPVSVMAEDARLRQVVLNLVGNALQHTPSTAAITVSVTAHGDSATLTVADEGQGMDRATAERIFERFYRADPSRTSTTGGSGLGLAIARALVEAHGGTLTVDSAPGVGTAFAVTLARTGNRSDIAPNSG